MASPHANILVIAPYPAMIPDLEEVAKEFPQAHFSIESGDLGSGLETALSVFHLDFDIVVSRGGTAQLLEDELSLPVVEIKPTATELLTTLLAVPADVSAVAAVGFRNVLSSMALLDEHLPYDLDLYAIDYEDELPQALDAVAAEDYDLVLCDTKAFSAACERKLEAQLFVSDKSSIRSAFERAIELFSHYRALQSRVHFYQEVLHESGLMIVAFTADQRLLFSSLGAEDEPLLEELRERIPFPTGNRFVIRRGRRTYVVRKLDSDMEGQAMSTFAVSIHDAPSADRFAGFCHLDEISARSAISETPYETVGAHDALSELIGHLVHQRGCTVVTSDQDDICLQVAIDTYLSGPRVGQPLVRIECDLVDERSWSFLTENHRSPLYDTGLTILFHNLHLLRPDRWNTLMTLIRASRLDERCRTIMTARTSTTAHDELVARTCDALGCPHETVPPLHTWSNIDEIPSLLVAALAHLQNESTPTFEHGAEELLHRYRWPGGLSQLVRVLKRALVNRIGEMIVGNDILDALNREKMSDERPAEDHLAFSIMQPLSQTTHDIATMVLAGCNGNKSKAARILDVSRTTLYQLLER